MREVREALCLTWAGGCVTLSESLPPWASASFLPVRFCCSPRGSSAVLAHECRSAFRRVIVPTARQAPSYRTGKSLNQAFT